MTSPRIEVGNCVDVMTDADISRIHAPVGLQIGASGPAEIAVSIVAEVISAFRLHVPARQDASACSPDHRRVARTQATRHSARTT